MKILHRLPTLWEVLHTHQDQSSGKPVYGVTKEFVASRSIPTKKSLPPGIRTLISAHRLSKLYSQVPHPRVFVAGTQPSPSPSITELGDEISAEEARAAKDGRDVPCYRTAPSRTLRDDRRPAGEREHIMQGPLVQGKPK